MKKTGNKLYNNQAGIASIVVTMVMMIVITLIVLALAQIARREQRQALDKQLSSQAFYAAEAGINDAKNAIQNHGFNNNYTNCPNASAGNPPGTFYQPNPNIGADATHISASQDFNLPTIVQNALGSVSASTKYTCVLITQKPTSLEYGAVNLDNAVYANLKTPQPITSLMVGWDDNKNDFRNCAGACTFPSNAKWVDASGDPAAPVLRLDVTAVNGAFGLPANFSQQDLINHTFTVFLYPKAGNGAPGTVSFSLFSTNPNLSGQIINGNCKTGTANLRSCNVSLQFPGGGQPTNIFLRLNAIYGTASVSVQALNNGNPQTIDGGQQVIDVTGKASDVLRRLQARISPRPSNVITNNAADTTLDICKLYLISPSPAVFTTPYGSCP